MEDSTPDTISSSAAPVIDARGPATDLESIQTSHLRRVVDVPLSVTLRFGERAMRLREVLELSTGSLVELNREVEEPVDLVLGDRILARGEVVIIDGNYGLRVQEIIERVLPASALASG